MGIQPARNDHDDERLRPGQANLDLIAALRSAAPALLRAAELLPEMVQALEYVTEALDGAIRYTSVLENAMGFEKWCNSQDLAESLLARYRAATGQEAPDAR